MRLPTVKIRRENGDPKIINATDYDPEVHELFDASDEPEAAALPTREEIETMPKGQVRRWLEAHGAEVPQGAKVGEMRAALTAVMFVEDSEL